jgi:FlaA1/EpsC-like NDP-sugar epimerase
MDISAVISSQATPLRKNSIVFPDQLTNNIGDKIVMVTGSGSPVGRQLCHKIIQTKPRTTKRSLVATNQYNSCAPKEGS